MHYIKPCRKCGANMKKCICIGELEREALLSASDKSAMIFMETLWMWEKSRDLQKASSDASTR